MALDIVMFSSGTLNVNIPRDSIESILFFSVSHFSIQSIIEVNVKSVFNKSSNLLDLLLWQKRCQSQIHYVVNCKDDHKFFPSLYACPFAAPPIKRQSQFLYSSV